jgi:hypothetical protein
MGSRWNRQPLHWVRRRLLAASTLDEEAKQHVLLWFDDLASYVPDEPRQQAAAASAAGVYAEYVRLQVKALTMDPQDPESEKVSAALMRCPANIAKALRMIGIRTDRPNVKKHSPFTAPTADSTRHQTPADDESGMSLDTQSLSVR